MRMLAEEFRQAYGDDLSRRSFENQIDFGSGLSAVVGEVGAFWEQGYVLLQTVTFPRMAAERMAEQMFQIINSGK